jgi:hypothetical protein
MLDVTGKHLVAAKSPGWTTLGSRSPFRLSTKNESLREPDVMQTSQKPDTAITSIPRPYCTLCDRSVETFTCDTGVEVLSKAGSLHYRSSEELIYTVGCHGEYYRWSNLRGRLT